LRLKDEKTKEGREEGRKEDGWMKDGRTSSKGTNEGTVTKQRKEDYEGRTLGG
jgi:hypothetical protein